MKKIYVLLKNTRYYSAFFLLTLWHSPSANAQSCPANGVTSINSFPNTYYSAGQNTLSAGATSFTLGTAKYGATSISSGDILLIIQMQGAQFNQTNSGSYGDGSGTGSGYLVNSNLLAGNMEYVVAANNVPLSGGTLTITTGLVNSYQNSAYGADGQYTYQVIRVPVYYDLQLTGTITPPRWDGALGGVLVLYATDNIDLNTQTVDASGRGFRGGGGRSLSGASALVNTDYYTLSRTAANASKGEGIAGTPKYLNDSDMVLYSTGVEGYPKGSYAMGAPGNAGGGGTDGNPSSNDQNTGGGGGGNGGAGGIGGWAWSSSVQSGGKPGAVFAQASASRLVMGGGGGAGTTNNATGTPTKGFASSGAAGGGLIILYAGTGIIGTGTILANGAAGNTTVLNDGAGGGGAGGSILIYSKNGITSNITAQAAGGTGGINQMSGGPSHGPGGGGGGGIIYSNSTLAAASTVAGGVAGTTNGTTTSFGAGNGSVGIISTTMSPSAPAQFPLTCVILATSFLDLSAVLDNGAVTLDWTVIREVNTIDYVIERSSDGINFSAIGSIAYKTGGAYQYVDEQATAAGGTLYYRIHEIETGGQSVYSKIVSVQLNGLNGKLSVYPNPAQSLVNLSFETRMPETVCLRLFDLHGSQLWSSQYNAQTGRNTVTVDCLRTLPEGIYMLQWSDGLKPEIVTIMVRH